MEEQDKQGKEAVAHDSYFCGARANTIETSSTQGHTHNRDAQARHTDALRPKAQVRLPVAWRRPLWWKPCPARAKARSFPSLTFARKPNHTTTTPPPPPHHHLHKQLFHDHRMLVLLWQGCCGGGGRAGGCVVIGRLSPSFFYVALLLHVQRAWWTTTTPEPHPHLRHFRGPALAS